MKSFIVSTIIILGAYGFIYGINKLFYRYSFFHSAPSIKTLSKGGIAWFFLSIIAFFGISMGMVFSRIGFDLLYEGGVVSLSTCFDDSSGERGDSRYFSYREKCLAPS